LLFLIGFWPFNFTEKNNAVISPSGGLEIARHGTAYTALAAGKFQDLKQFAIHIDLTTSSDGQDSLAKIFGTFINQGDKNFFVGQWKDGIELHVRTERNPGGMIYGEDGVLEKEKRTSCLIMYDGQKMHLYANGALIRRDNRGSISFGNWSSDYPLVLGTDATGRAQWKGTIYEVAIFDRALSPDEIRRVTGDKEGYRLQAAGDRRDKGSGYGLGIREEKAIKKENPPLSPFVKGGKEKSKVADARPVVHYVFTPENTYETEFRGKRALGVRDLGQGEAADLVIPEQFAPYQRVYLGWDPDWTRNRSDWMDAAVNILGFVPFGLLLTLAFRNGSRSVKCCVLSEDKEIKDNSGKIFAAVVLAVAVGLVVSFAIEYLQAYLPSRDSSVRDLVTNTAGTAIGAVIAAWMVSMRKAQLC
jgi:hypothetical protein